MPPTTRQDIAEFAMSKYATDFCHFDDINNALIEAMDAQESDDSEELQDIIDRLNEEWIEASGKKNSSRNFLSSFMNPFDIEEFEQDLISGDEEDGPAEV